MAGQDQATYSAHSSILSQRSIVLKKVLSPLTGEEKSKEGILRHRIMLNGYNSEDLELLLEFAYNRRNLKTRDNQQLARLKVIISDLELQSLEGKRGTLGNLGFVNLFVHYLDLNVLVKI